MEESVSDTILGGLVVVLIEYFIVQPLRERTKKIPNQKWISTGIAALILAIPFLLLQWLSVFLVDSLFGNTPDKLQVDMYGYLFAGSALFWGCVWTYWIRERLIDYIECQIKKVGGNA